MELGRQRHEAGLVLWLSLARSSFDFQRHSGQGLAGLVVQCAGDSQAFALLGAQGRTGSDASLLGKSVDHGVEGAGEGDELGAFGLRGCELRLRIAKVDAFVSSARSSSGARARRIRIRLMTSIATSPAPRMASSPRRIGALMVTGLSASNANAKTSTAALAKAAR